MNRQAKASSAGSTEGSKRRHRPLLAILALALCVLGSGASAANAEPPAVVMGTVTGASYTSAHVTGEVDPKGKQTEYSFEVSTDGVNWQGGGLSGGFPTATTGFQKVEGDLQNLKPDTTYLIRLTAFNQEEFSSSASDAPYPEITTLGPVAPPAFAAADAASEVAYTTAKATGEVERPSGNSDPAFDVNCRFEYVSDQQFNDNLNASEPGFANAASADCAENPITEEKAEAETEGPKVDVSADLANLNVNTTYHLRLHAETAGGSLNADAPTTFTTLNPSAPVVTIDPVTTFTATTAHFSGHVTPGGSDQVFATDWEFHCTPACPGLSGLLEPSSNPEEVKGDVEGLEPNTSYEVELLATNQGGQGSAGPVSFKTPAVGPDAQTIPAFVLEGGDKALLGARINPHNSDTHYHFKWGETESHGHLIPAEAPWGSAGSGGANQIFTQEIAGLEPATKYHFQVIAESDAGTTVGDDVTFTTPKPVPDQEKCANEEFRTGPSAQLPECRAFELASIPDLAGSVSNNSNAGVQKDQGWSPVATSGEAIFWKSDVAAPDVDSDGKFDWYVSRRSPTGWKAEFVAPPGSKLNGALSTPYYATPDLSRILWMTYYASIDPNDPDDAKNKSHGAEGTGEQYSDLYRREADGSFVRLTQGPTEKATPNGVGYNHPSTSAVWSPDALKVAFTSPDDNELTSGAPEGSVYERSGETTTLVNPDHPGSGAVYGISADGGTVLYSNTGHFGSPLDTTLFLRTDGLSRSVTIGEGSCLSGCYSPWMLTTDGHTVLYSSPEQSSSDDTDSSQDIFVFDVPTETSRRISAPTGASTGPNSGNAQTCPGSWEGDCAAQFVAATKDAATVYFVSPELLDGTNGVSGQPNIYERSGETTTYVGTPLPVDGTFGFLQLWGGGAQAKRSQLTSDQTKLMFESSARLTAYDNAGQNEVYIYDSPVNELSCVSCRLDGAQPVGPSGLFFGSDLRRTGNGINARFSDKSGEKVFFTTEEALSSQDSDDVADVYVADRAHGTISLLTPDTPTPVYFWGTGEDGRDAFINASTELTPESRSRGSFKLWDARIGGGFPQASPPATETCQGEQCHGQPSVPPDPFGSATSQVQGPANQRGKHCKGKRCSKHKKKRHKRKHHHSGKAKHHHAAGRGSER